MLVASEISTREERTQKISGSASFLNRTEMPCPASQPLTPAKTPFGEKYELKEHLGEGSFGLVFRCIEKETKKEFAVKQFDTTRFTYNKEDVDREVAIWQDLKHRNIVTLYDDSEDEGFRYLVMDLAGGRSLFDEVVKTPTHTEGQARGIMKQVLRALCFLHKNRVVHRDIKPDNVLLNFWHDGSGDVRVSVKLADFGLARKLPRDLDVTECDASGAPLFLAPETILEEPIGRPVDMWSCGVILYLLLVGYPPFWNNNDEKLLLSILQGSFSMPSPYWDNVSENAKDLIRKLLVLNPEERLTASQALKHPWFNARQQTTVVTVTSEEMANSPVRKLSPGSHKKHFFAVACGIRAMLKFRHKRVRQGQGRRLSLEKLNVDGMVSETSNAEDVEESHHTSQENEDLFEENVLGEEGKRAQHKKSLEKEFQEICRELQDELDFGGSSSDEENNDFHNSFKTY